MTEPQAPLELSYESAVSEPAERRPLTTDVAMTFGNKVGVLVLNVAGTIVIRLDRPEGAPEVEPAADATPLSLTRQQLARIGRRELQLIRGTLRRVTRLDEHRREALLEEVAETMRTRLELAELPSQDRAAFLRNLLALAERYSR